MNASTERSPEAKETFVCDFLNDPTSKLPESLRNELKNLRHTDKKLCFFVNPPYGQASNLADNNQNSKDGIQKSGINAKMKHYKLSLACRELLTQFIFRMDEIVDEFKLNKDQVVIATFSNPTFMAGPGFKEFRKYFFDKWTYDSAFMIESNEFVDCGGGWPISFSIWHNIKSKSTQKKFLHNVYKSNSNGSIDNIGIYNIYNLDGEVDLNSYCKIKNANKENAIGSIYFSAGPDHNQFTSIESTPNSMILMMLENIDICVAHAAARQVTVNNWMNIKAAYCVPNFSNAKYPEFNRDAYISTIDNYQKSTNDYKNNFFPFSKAETYKLLGQELMKNEVDEKRWCLANGKFDNPSPEGKAVLDAFAACIKASAPFRREFGQSHPELQLDHWDAGYRQLKQLFSEVCTNEFKQFKAALKTLKTKMQPLVYELGFLRK